jgi:hypothetical protein
MGEDEPRFSLTLDRHSLHQDGGKRQTPLTDAGDVRQKASGWCSADREERFNPLRRHSVHQKGGESRRALHTVMQRLLDAEWAMDAVGAIVMLRQVTRHQKG